MRITKLQGEQAMRLQSVLSGDLEKRFLNYKRQFPDRSESALGAELIDLALRIKEHQPSEGDKSNREILEELLLEVSLIKRVSNNIFVNTFVNESEIGKIRHDEAVFKIKDMMKLSNADSSEFLNKPLMLPKNRG